MVGETQTLGLLCRRVKRKKIANDDPIADFPESGAPASNIVQPRRKFQHAPHGALILDMELRKVHGSLMAHHLLNPGKPAGCGISYAKRLIRGSAAHMIWIAEMEICTQTPQIYELQRGRESTPVASGTTTARQKGKTNWCRTNRGCFLWKGDISLSAGASPRVLKVLTLSRTVSWNWGHWNLLAVTAEI